MTANLQIPPEFDDVSKSERIAFVEELWNRIAQEPFLVPMPQEHKRVLDARFDAYRKNPKAGQPWNEARDHLLAKFRKS
jgi:putative addiction module component (TIGR02574 family)